MTEKRLFKEWEVSAFDRVENEWTTTMNHAYEVVPEVTNDMFVSQAPPVRITPSRRKPASTDFDHTIATIGDIHFPFQNQRRLDLSSTGLRILEPSAIDLLGDNLDNPNYSRFGTRREWADSSQRGIDELAEYLAQLRSDHPDTTIRWHQGNHDIRQELRMREYNDDLLGIKRAGESQSAMSLQFLLRLDELGVELIEGYPSARVIVNDKNDNPQLEIHHGHVTSGNLAALKVIQSAFLSFNTGHTHNLGVVSKTFWVGDEEHTIYGAESGTYADQNKVPSGKYAPNTNVRMNWQSGIIDWVVDENGAIPGISPITDHAITVRGKQWKS